MSTYDPNERFSLHPLEGEEVLAELLGAEEPEEARPDTTSDPGVLGGVDAPNEGAEEPEMEPEEPEAEA
jgi:hypothetical protein